MRIGSNPAKFDNVLASDIYHRVIIPVYIPNHEGYFKQQFEIFKFCLTSLLATVHQRTRITIYINACASDVCEYIETTYKSNPIIDQVFISDINMGKINAILAAAKGNIEPLITITDADVLFKHGWQQETEKLLNAFPEAGMVSPVPSSKGLLYHTSNNWLYCMTKGKARVEPVADRDALVKFDDSLGPEVHFYDDIHLKEYVTISNSKGERAVFGCGHFVVTMRREILDEGSNSPAFIKIQGGVEAKFIDIPNEKLGFMRLATLDNYAYHLGNTKEDWMAAELNNILSSTASTVTPFNHNKANPYKFLGLNIVQKILHRKFLIPYFLKLAGLRLPKGYI